MFRRGALTFARVRGIPLRAHWTLLLAVLWIALVAGTAVGQYSAGAGVDPQALQLSPWLLGVIVAVLLFASVTVHELSHSLIALSRGDRVRSITLMMLGGVSAIEPRRDDPIRGEAWMAGAGPLTSAVLGGIGILAYRWIPAGAAPDARVIVYYLGVINLVLAVFNLLPAFPMDGGRVLRGLLAPRMGNLRATRIAAGVGKGFAILFGILGLVSFNILLVVIAFFVYAGANAEAESMLVRSALSGIRTRDLLDRSVDAMGADESVSAAARRLRERRRLGLPVTSDGRVLGVVGLPRVKAVPATNRDTTSVRDITDEVEPLQLDTPLSQAVERMSRSGAVLLPVLDESERLVGVVRRGDVERYLELHDLEEGLGDRA